MTAPVILFGFNRPEHISKTLEALEANELADQTELFIFIDGPRTDSDIPSIKEVETVCSKKRNFKNVSILKRTSNFGLARSIIKGVTDTLEKFESVIVLEDDLITSKFFLRYMNENLERYKNEDKVWNIHGYKYPIEIENQFFLRGADCWGWGTWARAWKNFESNGAKLLSELKENGLQNDFDLNGSYPYVQMLRDQIAGLNSSWAVRWHAKCFLENKLTLYPSKTLVKNIGFDNSGTHCNSEDFFDSDFSSTSESNSSINVEESNIATKELESFFRSNRKPGFKANLKKVIKLLIGFILEIFPFEFFKKFLDFFVHFIVKVYKFKYWRFSKKVPLFYNHEISFLEFYSKKSTSWEFLNRGIFPLSLMEDNSKILDFCCGNGFYSFYFFQNKGFVLGVDKSNEAIRFANRNYASAKIKFTSEDLSTFQDSFDYIVWASALYYFEKSEVSQVISQLKRLAKNNTKIFIGVPEACGFIDHKFEFSSELEFRDFLKNYFKIEDIKTVQEAGRKSFYAVCAFIS